MQRKLLTMSLKQNGGCGIMTSHRIREYQYSSFMTFTRFAHTPPNDTRLFKSVYLFIAMRSILFGLSQMCVKATVSWTNLIYMYVYIYIYIYITYNTLRISDTLWLQWTWSSMVQAMTCCLLGARPSSKYNDIRQNEVLSRKRII